MADDQIGPAQQAMTACTYDISRHARYGKVARNSDNQEDQISGIRRPKSSISGALYLVDVQLDHLLLDRINDRPKNVAYR